MEGKNVTNFVEAHLAGDYASETESNCRLGSFGARDGISVPIAGTFGGSRPPPPAARSGHVGAGMQGPPPAGMDAYSRHKKFINDYVISLGEKRVEKYLADRQPKVGKTDYDILQENYKFIRETEHDDMSNWEVRMAVKYYNKLFKEYCIADMSRYKTAQIGLRWRTQKEVFSGDGQFLCGNQACKAPNTLSSYEMNFVYHEHGEKKEALVKLRLCPECGLKLNYKKLKEREKEIRKQAKASNKARRRHQKKRKKGKDTKVKREKKSESDGGSNSSSSSPSSSSSSDAEESPVSSSSAVHSSSIAREKREQFDMSDWHQVASKSSGKVYWYNVRTGATQWHPPQPPKSICEHNRQMDREEDGQGGASGKRARGKGVKGTGDAGATHAAEVKGKRGAKLDTEQQCLRSAVCAGEGGCCVGAGVADDVHALLGSAHSSLLVDEDGGAMWRRSLAAQDLAGEDNDEFDEYFKGMFP